MAFRSLTVLTGAIGLLAIMSCGNSGSPQNDKGTGNEMSVVAPDKLTTIHFDSLEHNFGTITEGEKVVYAFKFENSGKYPLLISFVRASCGCTVTDYPKGLIKPGEINSIEVRFNAEGKKGFQSKTVSVIANTDPAETQLFFKANVLESASKE
jgi:hypothetical protein